MAVNSNESSEDEIDSLKEKTIALEERISRIVEELVQNIDSRNLKYKKDLKSKYAYKAKKKTEDK